MISIYDILILLLYCVIAFLIAYFLGKKRQIGLWWSLFFNIFLTPIIGFVIVMLSSKYYGNNKKSTTKIVFGWLIISWAVISIISIFNLLSYGVRGVRDMLFFEVGLIGLGIYLIILGKGKIVNKKLIESKNN